LSKYGTITLNLMMTDAATGGACGSGNDKYVVGVTNGDNTDTVDGNWLYSAAGHNVRIQNSDGYSTGWNITGIDPRFVNPSLPGAPNCGGTSDVVDCMAAVIANFTPQADGADAYGYQTPGANIYEPEFPQWLCSVTNMPSGIITMGCAGEGDNLVPAIHDINVDHHRCRSCHASPASPILQER
jgi:hypothetical protein